MLFFRELGFGLDEIRALMSAPDSGASADSREAMDAVEAHRRHITERFYGCTPRFQVQLGEMYVQDPRFRATYEEIEAGLAVFVRDAIVANAARQDP